MAARRRALGQSLVVVRGIGAVICAFVAAAVFSIAASASPAAAPSVPLTPAPTSVDHATCEVGDAVATRVTIAPSAGGTVVAFTLVGDGSPC